MKKTHKQADFSTIFSKRLILQEKTNNPLQFYLQMRPSCSQKTETLIETPIQKPTRQNSLSTLKKTSKPLSSLKTILQSLDTQEKLNFHSDMIYIRKNLFNPQIKHETPTQKQKNLKSLQQTPKPERSENLIQFKKLQIIATIRKQASKPLIPIEETYFFNKKYIFSSHLQ